MSVTPVILRNIVNAPGAPAYPANGYTLHAQDWAQVREALQLGAEAIYPKGVKVGSSGFELVTTTPFLMGDGSSLQFLDGALESAVVGALTHDGELSMRRFTVLSELRFRASTSILLEGGLDIHLPVQDQTNLITYRDGAQVANLDVFRDASTHVMDIVEGDFLSNSLNGGFAMRNATTVSRISMRDDGVLVVKDATDIDARPVVWENEREIVLATPGSSPIESIVGVDGVSAAEVSSSPRIFNVGLLVGGVQVQHLSLGVGPDDINVDALWAAGAGSGDVASLVTVAEKAAISTLLADVATLQAEVAARVKYIRTPAGTLVAPGADGYIQLVNSSSVIFDSPADGTLRAVSSGGGGGGGGGVASITVLSGLLNLGSSENPQLKVDIGAGLVFSSGSIVPDWGAGSNNVARGNHTHAGVYSPIGHTHAYASLADITYESLNGNGDVGTGSGQVASGDDARFHTQGTDQGTTATSFIIRSAFAGAPDASVYDIVFKRGSGTNYRIAWDDSTDVLKAGLVGSEKVFVFTDDSRLSDARTPASHSLASHTGLLAGALVTPGNAPASYTPTEASLNGHLEGVDAALAASAGGQTFSGSVMSTELVAGVFVVGNGIVGMKIIRGGTITRCTVNAQAPLGGGEAVTFEIQNVTRSTVATFTIAAGQMAAVVPSAGLAVFANDEICIRVSAVSGTPDVGTISFLVLKE